MMYITVSEYSMNLQLPIKNRMTSLITSWMWLGKSNTILSYLMFSWRLVSVWSDRYCDSFTIDSIIANDSFYFTHRTEAINKKGISTGKGTQLFNRNQSVKNHWGALNSLVPLFGPRSSILYRVSDCWQEWWEDWHKYHINRKGSITLKAVRNFEHCKWNNSESTELQNTLSHENKKYFYSPDKRKPIYIFS